MGYILFPFPLKTCQTALYFQQFQKIESQKPKAGSKVLPKIYHTIAAASEKTSFIFTYLVGSSSFWQKSHFSEAQANIKPT